MINICSLWYSPLNQTSLPGNADDLTFNPIPSPLNHLLTSVCVRVHQEFRAFELLRSGLDRSKYLLVKEAKIIAMTCTHAALKRHDLVELGFKVRQTHKHYTRSRHYDHTHNSGQRQLVTYTHVLVFSVWQHPDGGSSSDPGDRDLHPSPAAGKLLQPDPKIPPMLNPNVQL